MIYSELLKSAINNSRLSLNEISQELKESGFSADKTYLSKLQNGRIPPASNKLNEALAKILHIDALELKVAAYREKIPQDVLEKLLIS
ncbi:XRE family transcriptional regulator [Lysinibacillus capsici]|uniref:XRE family transcriptional regulator n=1 Tax=Lysinibacillus capsici TaxID=2115968 RepID=UPI00289C951A|nr:XRE family transcriptional regulator [Lysinibacillus capsici]